MLKKIHHVGIVVRKLEEAFGFYKDTLGLPLQDGDGPRPGGQSRFVSYW